MKNFILAVLAVFLFMCLIVPGFIYTFIYYDRKEKDKHYKYLYRCAFSVDVLANCWFGELFEALISTVRCETLFGSVTSISAATGELIVSNRLNKRGIWFSKKLDKVFKEENHCVNAYKKEFPLANIPS